MGANPNPAPPSAVPQIFSNPPSMAKKNNRPKFKMKAIWSMFQVQHHKSSPPRPGKLGKTLWQKKNMSWSKFSQIMV